MFVKLQWTSKMLFTNNKVEILCLISDGPNQVSFVFNPIIKSEIYTLRLQQMQLQFTLKLFCC